MNEQKLKPGHFWAEVWDSGTSIYKRIVIDICRKECVCVCKGLDEENYFNDKSYDTVRYRNFKKLEPPKMRHMTTEEMAEFVLENPCIIGYKSGPDGWFLCQQLNRNDKPEIFLWKKRFKDDWQEFLTEDKE